MWPLCNCWKKRVELLPCVVTWQVEERHWCCHRQLGLHGSLGGSRRLNSLLLKDGERRMLLLQKSITCSLCMLCSRFEGVREAGTESSEAEVIDVQKDSA